MDIGISFLHSHDHAIHYETIKKMSYSIKTVFSGWYHPSFNFIHYLIFEILQLYAWHWSDVVNGCLTRYLVSLCSIVVILKDLIWYILSIIQMSFKQATHHRSLTKILSHFSVLEWHKLASTLMNYPLTMDKNTPMVICHCNIYLGELVHLVM